VTTRLRAGCDRVRRCGHSTPQQARRDLERQHRLSLLDWTVVRPRGTTVLHKPRLVAVDVYRELERAAERLGLPMIPASVALWQ